MLAGETRIPPVAIETCPADLRETLGEQRKLWGKPLYPYLFYARHPPYFRAANIMWTALQEEATRVPGTLRALINRRVAWWNHCDHGHAPRRRRHAVRMPAATLRRRYHRGANDDHCVAERIVAFQSRASYPIPRILEAMTDRPRRR